MNITGVVNTGGAAGGTQVGLAAMDGQDFMKVLIKQLQYQDPFKPMDNDQMVSQIASIRELELNTRLTDRLEKLTDQQRFGSAAALLGRYAMGRLTLDDGTVIPIEGVITGVQFTPGGEVMLELDTGESLPLRNVVQVLAEAP